MSKKIDVIVTAHKEGELLYATTQSAIESISKLKSGFDVEISILFYLDNPDTITEVVARELADAHGAKVAIGSNGDPGQSRLAAIDLCGGDYIALLDGDDLWCENWLHDCYQETLKIEGSCFVLHPEYNLIFGYHNALVKQGDIKSRLFSPDFLRIGNYWDALCFCPKEIFKDHPYRKNDVEAGFAHEDFLWAIETYLNGIEHRLIQDTIHFKRRRTGSVSVLADAKKVKVHLTDIVKY